MRKRLESIIRRGKEISKRVKISEANVKETADKNEFAKIIY